MDMILRHANLNDLADRLMQVDGDLTYRFIVDFVFAEAQTPAQQNSAIKALKNALLIDSMTSESREVIALYITKLDPSADSEVLLKEAKDRRKTIAGDIKFREAIL